MDVVCDRCNTEYEFDDALVSERGTTVKCTNCGHQFRIFRPKSDGTVARPWILKRADGKTATFDSLAVLQRWIGEGKASRADLLSRDGVDWKPLGSIAELEGFFTQAEAKGRATASSKPVTSTMTAPGAPPAVPPRRATTPGMPPAPPPVAPPPRPSGGNGAPYAAPPPPSVPSLPAPPLPPPAVPSLPPIPPAATTSAQPATRKAPTPPSVPVAERPSKDYSMGGQENELTTEAYDFGDDTGIMEKWGADGKPKAAKPVVGPPPVAPRSSTGSMASAAALDEPAPARPARSSKSSGGSKGALVAVGLVAVLSGGAFAAWQAGVFSGNNRSAATRDAVSTAIESAENTARAGTRAGFDDAKESLTALMLAPANRDDPRVLAARAAVLAARGESLRSRAEDLEARAQRGGPDAATVRAEASIIRASALADIDRARTDAAAAEAGASRVGQADRGRFERALAEIARVVRVDLASARQHATAAKSAGANTDLIDGLIARDAGDFDAAVAALRRAADATDSDARARLALARLYASRGDRAGALEQLSALLRVRPQHDDGQALSTAIEAGLPPLRDSALAQATGDAGAAAQGSNGTAPVAQAPVAAADSGAAAIPGLPSTTTGGGSAPSGAFAGRSYDQLVEEGERQRARGQNERARSAFMAALGLRGDGCEAVTGLGFVEMRSGETGAAVLLFRRAIGLNSRFSDAYIGLGQAYERQGNAEQALRAYRQYMEINPGGSHAREAQARIAALDHSAGSGGGSGSGGSDTPSNSGSGSSGSGSSDNSAGSSGTSGSSAGSGSAGSTGSGSGSSGSSGSSGASSSPSEGSGSAGSTPSP